MKNLFSVSGKVAVITGGSRGIGAMIAQGMVESGVKVYITARKVEELKATETALNELGECIAIPSDLSSMEGITQFVDAVMAQEKKIDILVNNAGATWGQPIDEFSESGWDKVMDLNVKSPFFLTQKFLPALRQAARHSDPARVINIASVNALRNSGMTNYSYTASKSAIIRLTEHLACDLVKDNINVNAIAPGLFPSKMTAFMLTNDDAEAAVASVIPRGRIGTMEDAAGTAIYLCSRASAWVTGNTTILDGGSVTCA